MLTDFGQLCRRFRMARGMLLKNMAEDLGYPSSYVSSLETGKRPVERSYIDELKATYDLNLVQYYQLLEAAGIYEENVTISLFGLEKDRRDLIIRLLDKLRKIPDSTISTVLEQIESGEVGIPNPTMDDVIKTMKERKDIQK